MSLSSAADARAFEVAQRDRAALRELQDASTMTRRDESWPKRRPSPPHLLAVCATGVYRPYDLANTSFPARHYTVEIMLVTVAEAECDQSVSRWAHCFRNAAKVCTNLGLLRSTGTITDNPAGRTPRACAIPR